MTFRASQGCGSTWPRAALSRSLGAGGLLLAAATLSAQQAPAKTSSAAGAQLEILRDVMVSQWKYYKDADGRLCLDPTIASYRTAARERWSPEVLAAIAADVRIGLDTLTTTREGGLPGCARSQAVARISYGRPRTFPDSAAAMVFVLTRLDARGQVDSLKFDLRINRKAGKWNVDGLLADTMVVHQYVKGDGCYRLWHGPLEPRSSDSSRRIDTIDVRAETKYLGASWQTVPSYRLTSRGPPGGVTAGPWTSSLWYVTHDSIHFEWGGSWSAVFAELHVVGDSLRGRIRAETDAVVPNPPSATINGRRVACPTK